MAQTIRPTRRALNLEHEVLHRIAVSERIQAENQLDLLGRVRKFAASHDAPQGVRNWLLLHQGDHGLFRTIAIAYSAASHSLGHPQNAEQWRNLNGYLHTVLDEFKESFLPEDVRPLFHPPT